MGVQKYIVGVIFLILLLWGPVDLSPQALIVRLGYLIVLPAIAWFILSWIWKRWQPNKETENQIGRILAGITAGVLLIGAVWMMQAKTHLECMHEIQTRDGRECVGDYERVDGPNKGGALLCLIAAGIALRMVMQWNAKKDS